MHLSAAVRLPILRRKSVSGGRWPVSYTHLDVYKRQSLPEVMITGERPVVKASQGKLVYDLPRLIRDLPVDNAYDV